MASKGPKDRKNSNGHDGGTRKGRASLAAQARAWLKHDDGDGSLFFKFYEKILEGKVPKMVKNEDGSVDFVEDESLTRTYPPTTDQRMLALARVTERAYGQPAQHTHIEAEVRAELQAIVGGVDPKYIGKLSPDALRTIAHSIKQLNAPKPEENAEIPDAEFVDVPDDESETET